MIECEALWTTKDVAEYLGMSEAFVRKAKEEMGLPFIKLGAKLRFTPDTVREWSKGLEETDNPEHPLYLKLHASDPGLGTTYIPASGITDEAITWLKAVDGATTTARKMIDLKAESTSGASAGDKDKTKKKYPPAGLRWSAAASGSTITVDPDGNTWETYLDSKGRMQHRIIEEPPF